MQTFEPAKTIIASSSKVEQERPFFSPSLHTGQTERAMSLANPASAFFHSRIVQPKLTINEPGDQYEQEADVMADRVMRMEKPRDKRIIQTKPLNTFLHHQRYIQRQPSNTTPAPCPTTITASTTLTTDCSNGIIIAADNIFLDGNGHKLTGSGVGAPIELRNRAGVTVRNCIMENFNEGITLRNSTGNNFLANTITNNVRDGFDLNNSHENNLVGNTIINNQINGIELDDSNSNLFVNNSVQNNGASNGDNISLDRSNSNTFLLNNASNSNQAGIHLDQDSNLNSFALNTSNNNQRNGFRIDDRCDDNDFFLNTSNNNQRDGFRITQNSNSNNFTRNTANNNQNDGFHIENSNDNILSNNTASNNASDDLGLPSGIGNKCINNTFTHQRCPP